MSTPTGTHVYTGQWTDWSKGSVLGNQITLANTQANLLVAFIAVFITYTGGVVWSIVAFALHQSRVTADPRDGVYHQVQALLSNPFSPLVFSRLLLKVVLAWKHSAAARKRALFSAIGIALIALTIWVTFALGGLLLSFVATRGAVLLHIDVCEYLNSTKLENLDPMEQNYFVLAVDLQGLHKAEQARDYALTCYPSRTSKGSVSDLHNVPAADCDFFVQPFLNWTMSRLTVCPFPDKHICKGTESNVVQFDTGYLNTHDHLGRNAQERDRLSFRRVVTCAPIVTDGYSTGFINTTHGIGDIYSYGLSRVPQGRFSDYLDLPGFPDTSNATFAYAQSSYLASDAMYTLFTVDSIGIGAENQPIFTPIPALASNGTYVTLLFLANRAYFIEPTDDPFFNATALLPSTDKMSIELGQLYYDPNPGSVLGCQTKFELCNPSLDPKKCMVWDKINDLMQGLDSGLEALLPLSLNQAQVGEAAALAFLLYNSAMGSIIDHLREDVLVASDYRFTDTGISNALEPEQWIVELQNLQAVSLAFMQRNAFDLEIPTSDDTLKSYMQPVSDPSCHDVKFRSTAYTSFSVMSLGLIFGFGGLLNVSQLIMLFVVPWWQKRRKHNINLRLNWNASQLLRLQRVAFEDRSLGSWKGAIDDPEPYIPVTGPGDVFHTFTAFTASSTLKNGTMVQVHASDSRSTPRSSTPDLTTASGTDHTTTASIQASPRESATGHESTRDTTAEYLIPPIPEQWRLDFETSEVTPMIREVDESEGSDYRRSSSDGASWRS